MTTKIDENAIAAAASVIGSVDDIVQVVKVVGFVASDPSFTGQPGVINGASDLLREVFGDRLEDPRTILELTLALGLVPKPE